MIKVKISGKDTGHITLDNMDMVMLEKQVRIISKAVEGKKLTKLEKEVAYGLTDVLNEVMEKWDDIHGKIFGKA